MAGAFHVVGRLPRFRAFAHSFSRAAFWLARGRSLRFVRRFFLRRFSREKHRFVFIVAHALRSRSGFVRSQFRTRQHFRTATFSRAGNAVIRLRGSTNGANRFSAYVVDVSHAGQNAVARAAHLATAFSRHQDVRAASALNVFFVSLAEEQTTKRPSLAAESGAKNERSCKRTGAAHCYGSG